MELGQEYRVGMGMRLVVEGLFVCCELSRGMMLWIIGQVLLIQLLSDIIFLTYNIIYPLLIILLTLFNHQPKQPQHTIIFICIIFNQLVIIQILYQHSD